MKTKTKRAKAPGRTASKPPAPAVTKKTTRKKPGRPKGALDMRSRNVRQAIQACGMTPLEYMLGVMNDTENESITVQERPYDGDPNTLTSEFLASVVASYGSSDDAPAPTSKRKAH